MVGKESPITWNQDILGDFTEVSSSTGLNWTRPRRRRRGTKEGRLEGERVAEQKWEEGKKKQCPRREKETAGIWIGKRGEDRLMKMKTGSAFWASRIFKCMRRKRSPSNISNTCCYIDHVEPMACLITSYDIIERRKKCQECDFCWYRIKYSKVKHKLTLNLS